MCMECYTLLNSENDDTDGVISISGETTCNSRGNLVTTLLRNCNLMIYNSRTLLSDHQWIRVQNHLNHISSSDRAIPTDVFNDVLTAIFLN